MNRKTAKLIERVREHAVSNPSPRWGRVRRMSDERIAAMIGERTKVANALKAVRASLRELGA